MVKMKNTQRILNLLMNGLLIAKLEKIASNQLTFQYHTEWLKTPGARPISLSLPLLDKIYSGDIVYHFFDNLLPDNPQIRSRIQTIFQITSNQPFDLLAAIGHDCVGAIQLTNNDAISFKKSIEAEPLNDKEIATILKGYRQYPLGMIPEISDFRISIAGAQEKSALLYYNNKWCRPLGTTPTTHIFKLPIGMIQRQQIDLSDSCENEWLCSQIISAFGMPVAHCEIKHFSDVKVLVIKRFDRQLSQDKSWIMRLPQEDMCQALGISPNLKYEADGGPGIKEIMNLLLGSQTPAEDRETFFHSQMLFWLLAASDGHAKNFSVLIEPEGKFRLAPLYDIISTYPLIKNRQLQKQKIKMAMSLKGKNSHYHWHNAQRRHFISTAKVVNFSPERAELILDDILNRVDSVIEKVKSILPDTFPKTISEAIFNGMKSMQARLSS